jgi:hypothetical protein
MSDISERSETHCNSICNETCPVVWYLTRILMLLSTLPCHSGGWWMILLSVCNSWFVYRTEGRTDACELCLCICMGSIKALMVDGAVICG